MKNAITTGGTIENLKKAELGVNAAKAALEKTQEALGKAQIKLQGTINTRNKESGDITKINEEIEMLKENLMAADKKDEEIKKIIAEKDALKERLKKEEQGIHERQEYIEKLEYQLCLELVKKLSILDDMFDEANDIADEAVKCFPVACKQENELEAMAIKNYIDIEVVEICESIKKLQKSEAVTVLLKTIEELNADTSGDKLSENILSDKWMKYSANTAIAVTAVDNHSSVIELNETVYNNIVALNNIINNVVEDNKTRLVTAKNKLAYLKEISQRPCQQKPQTPIVDRQAIQVEANVSVLEKCNSEQFKLGEQNINLAVSWTFQPVQKVIQIDGLTYSANGNEI